MESPLAARVAEVFARGEGVGNPRFLPLVTLDSGARYGLDERAQWIVASGEQDAAVTITRDCAHLLHEALEWKRDRFDDALADAARSFGLVADDVVFAFPVADLVRAVLEKRLSYLTRLALAWLRPTELRELRAEILVVSRDQVMPGPVRSLAERLVVPL